MVLSVITEEKFKELCIINEIKKLNINSMHLNYSISVYYWNNWNKENQF